MVTTTLGLLGIPRPPQTFADKTPSDYPSQGLLVREFDLWEEGYAGAVVTVMRGGTTIEQQCYSDIFLTQEIDNPITLQTRTDADGTSYGRFSTSVYVPYSYSLEIDDSSESGVNLLPITTLNGEDSSYALVKPTNASRARRLRDLLAHVIYVENFGQISSTPAANNTIIEQAISAAAEQGGGIVRFPAGTIAFTSFSLPEDVILQGDGMDATILQSETADKIIIVTGDSCGLKDLTLDGITLNSGSQGIYGENRDEFKLTNVRIKRFAIGMTFLGGFNHRYRNLKVSDCATGVRLHGDLNVSGGSTGNQFAGMIWDGGSVSLTTSSGIELLVRDSYCINHRISNVDFEDNIGTDGAILFSGARAVTLNNCVWDGNTNNVVFEDNEDLTLDFRETVGVRFNGGTMNGGSNEYDGLCQDVIFSNISFTETEFSCNIPENQIILEDCIEDSTLFTGDGTKVSRVRRSYASTVKGTTTDGTATTVYKTVVNPNENVLFEILATAERVNADEHAHFAVIVGAESSPATLNFDNQSANFIAGELITGSVSGATAIIVSQTDAGTSGTLNLGSVKGVFVDNETLTGDVAGSAQANGAMALGTLALSGTLTTVHASGSNAGNPPAGWDISGAVSSQEFQIRVTGAASSEVNWNLNIREVRI
jgi:hypothetical protein